MFTQKEIVKNTVIEFTDKHEGSLTFKLEIVQETAQSFLPVLYRRGIYCLKPTGEAEEVFADEILWTDACHLLPDNNPCPSVEEAVQKVLQALSRHFDIEP